MGRILKPATPHLPIQVPTVLKGTQTVNAPIIDSQVEIHNVQAPVPVQRKVAIPYDPPSPPPTLSRSPPPSMLMLLTMPPTPSQSRVSPSSRSLLPPLW